MNKKYCVYCHKNKVNGKRYIGLTFYKPERRWRNGHGYDSQELFANAISRYGWDNFEHIIVADGLTESDAKELEKKLIAQYKSNDRRYGYNITIGGESASGYRHTEKTRKKMSEQRKCEKNSFYGKHHTEETKEKIRKAKRNMSLETRIKMSKNHADVSGEKNPMYGKRGKDAHWYGKKHSVETKKKMSESAMGAKNHNSIPVLQIDKETDEIVNRFCCVREAERKTNINNSSIIRCCKEKQKTAGGYKWEYA